MNTKKQSKKINQNVLVVCIALLIILIVYAVVAVVNFFKQPAKTVLIKNGELINYEEVVGYVIRNEEIIDTSEYDGVIKTEVEDMTRVSKGAEIISYVSKLENQILEQINELDNKIENAINSQQTIYKKKKKSIDAEIEVLIYNNVRENNNLTLINEYKKNLNNQIQKKAKIVGELSPSGSELKELIEERASYEAILNDSEKTLTAPNAGLVSYRVDNYENILTYDSFSELTSDYLDNLKIGLNQVVPIDSNKVKIIDNFECYIAVPMESKEASEVTLNSTVYLRFANTGDELISSTIEYISKEEGKTLIIFKIKTNVEELSKYRKIGLDVVWWRSTGLKVNKDVISYTSVPVNTNADSGEQIMSNSGEVIDTIKLPTVNVKKTYYTNEVWIKILRETEDYVIIDNYSDAELRELGISDEDIEKRSTVKMYDELLIM